MQWPQVTCALKPALAYLAAACTAAGSGDRASTLLHLLSLQRLAALEASTHAAVAMLSHMRAVATSAIATQPPAAAAPPPDIPKPPAPADAASDHSDGRSSGLELRFPLEAAVLQGAVSATAWPRSRSPLRRGASAAAGCVSDVSVDCEIMDSDAMDTASAYAEVSNPTVLATAARAADTVLAAVASAVDDSLPGACGIGLAVRVSLNVVRNSAGRGSRRGAPEHVEVLLSPRTMMTAPEAVLATNAGAWAAAPSVPAVDAPAFASGCSCPSDCARGIRDLLCAAVQPGAEGAWQGAGMKMRLECVSPLTVAPLSAAGIATRDGAVHHLRRAPTLHQPHHSARLNALSFSSSLSLLHEPSNLWRVRVRQEFFAFNADEPTPGVHCDARSSPGAAGIISVLWLSAVRVMDCLCGYRIRAKPSGGR